MLLIPLCVSLGVNISDASPFHETFQKLGIPVRETYLEADDTRQQHISRKTAADFAADPDYRYEVLADTFMNVNVLPDGNVGRTSIYSSISNSDYGTFFYDIMGNAISYNNRVALAVGKIHCFSPSWESVICWSDTETRPTAMRKGSHRRLCVGGKRERPPHLLRVTDLLSRDAFDRLDFWDGLETISARTVVEDAGKGRDGDEEDFTGHFQRLDPREVFVPEDLERLPGIGPAKAEAIAAYRTEHGPFRTVDQLMEVSGIGEATLEALRPYITASAPG